MTIGKLSGQCDFGQKGQSYCNQRGQSCVAKRVKVAWLFQLRQVQKSDIKPNLPIIDEDGDGKPDTAGEYIYGSNPKRNQHF